MDVADTSCSFHEWTLLGARAFIQLHSAFLFLVDPAPCGLETGQECVFFGAHSAFFERCTTRLVPVSRQPSAVSNQQSSFFIIQLTSPLTHHHYLPIKEEVSNIIYYLFVLGSALCMLM